MTNQSGSTRAFTLMELMLVIGLCSFVMGIGVAAYMGMNRDLAWHSSVTTITSLLQAARNSATENRTPVSVIIKTYPVSDSGDKHVCTEAYATFVRRVGAWHFEETYAWHESDEKLVLKAPDAPFAASTVIEGAFSQKATPIGMQGTDAGSEPLPPSVLVQGKYGKGIEFLQWYDGAAVDPPQNLKLGEQDSDGNYRTPPVYRLSEGFRISAWVKPELPPDHEDDLFYYPVIARPVQENAERGEFDQHPVYSMSLLLDPDANPRVFRFMASVHINDDTDGDAQLDAQLDAMTKPLIRPGIWTHVAMLYSGADTGTAGNFPRVFINDEEITDERGLEKRVNGAPAAASFSASGRITASSQPVIIGADGMDGYFHGVIDEVIVDAVTTSERRVPPSNVLFRFWNCEASSSTDGMYRISFDRSGRLDLPSGDTLPVIALYSSGSKRAVLIGIELTGSIRTWSADEDRAEGEADDWLDGTGSP